MLDYKDIEEQYSEEYYNKSGYYNIYKKSVENKEMARLSNVFELSTMGTTNTHIMEISSDSEVEILED